jgi:uncharacterized protein with HEPN domain
MPKLSTQDNDRYRVGHIIEYCEKLTELTNTLSEEILEDDWMTTYAVMQLFEMLGEASAKISDELKAKYPEIPFQETTDLRNRLIHGYDDIEYHLLWLAMQEDVPPLLEQLYQLRKDLVASAAI